MAEILGLGMTHWPGLAPAKTRPQSLKRALQDPGLPEHLREPSGWPERLREEWGTDEGSSVGEAHRERVVNEIRKARQVLDDFKPDFVVIWGDDQYENFKEDVIPPFCILAYSDFTLKPWAQAHESAMVSGKANVWGEPADKSFDIRFHREAAKHLTTKLLASDFDVSYAY